MLLPLACQFSVLVRQISDLLASFVEVGIGVGTGVDEVAEGRVGADGAQETAGGQRGGRHVGLDHILSGRRHRGQ